LFRRNRLTSLVTAEGARPLTLDLLDPDEARQLLLHRLGSERIDTEPQTVAEIVALCAATVGPEHCGGSRGDTPDVSAREAG
jgi:hypothetical protein